MPLGVAFGAMRRKRKAEAGSTSYGGAGLSPGNERIIVSYAPSTAGETISGYILRASDHAVLASTTFTETVTGSSSYNIINTGPTVVGVPIVLRTVWPDSSFADSATLTI